MTPLLTKDDVAQRLAVAPRTVLDLAARGALASVRVGACVRFTQADVEAFIASQRRQPGPKAQAPVNVGPLVLPRTRRFS